MEQVQNSPSDNKLIWLSHHAEDHSCVLEIDRQMRKDGISVEWKGAFVDAQPWLCIVFLSEAYVNDERCRAELDVIRMSGIAYLVIYLEDVVLPQSLAMRIGRSRALFFKNFSTVEELCGKIYEAHEIGSFDAAKAVEHSMEVFRAHRRKQRMKWAIMGVIIAALLFLCGVRLNEYRLSNSSDESNQSVQSSQLTESEEWVLLDSDEYFVCVQKAHFYEDMGIWAVQLQLRNDTDDTVTFSSIHETINGFTVKTETDGYNRPDGEYSWGEQVSPHQTRVCRIEYPAMFWRTDDADRVVEHSGFLRVIGADGTQRHVQEFAVYPEGKQAAEEFSAAEIAEDSFVYRDDKIEIAYLGRKQYDSNGKGADLFYLHNLSDNTYESTFQTVGSESDNDFFSLLMTLQPDERLVIPAYWTDEIYTEAYVRFYYRDSRSEGRSFSDEIPITLER